MTPSPYSSCSSLQRRSQSSSRSADKSMSSSRGDKEEDKKGDTAFHGMMNVTKIITSRGSTNLTPEMKTEKMNSDPDDKTPKWCLMAGETFTRRQGGQTIVNLSTRREERTNTVRKTKLPSATGVTNRGTSLGIAEIRMPIPETPTSEHLGRENQQESDYNTF